MKIRTVTVGLPGTYLLCYREAHPYYSRTPDSWQPRSKPDSWRPHSKPVSVLGEFMLTYLAFDNAQRAEKTDAR